MDCKLCDHRDKDLKNLATHIRTKHGMSSEQYTIAMFHSGVRPLCRACDTPTRYVSFGFKEYCKDHAKLAMKTGGSKGGLAGAWNKGKTKDTDERLALHSAKVSGKANHFFGRQHTQETIQKISKNKTLSYSSLKERLLERATEFTLVTKLEEYVSRQNQYLLFECKTCGEVQPKTLQAFERGSRCYRCHPIGKSNWELSVFEFVRSLSPDAVSGDKKVLSPKEVDVYVPSKNFGIECHGLFWHSELGKPVEEFDKKSHLKKSELAEERGLTLLQIFEDEWRDNRNIVEEMIKHRLGLHTKKCKTWSTRVVELSTLEERRFFDTTHLSGYTPSKVCWGLKDRTGQIVSALSLRVPRHGSKYKNCIEVARYSNAIGLSVPGALSKLLKAAKLWGKLKGYERMMTYVDRRVGIGRGYIASGFKRCGSTGPDYWYTDNELRYDRFRYRSQNGMPEKQIACMSKVARIYGCGSYVYDMQI